MKSSPGPTFVTKLNVIDGWHVAANTACDVDNDDDMANDMSLTCIMTCLVSNTWLMTSLMTWTMTSHFRIRPISWDIFSTHYQIKAH